MLRPLDTCTSTCFIIIAPSARRVYTDAGFQVLVQFTASCDHACVDGVGEDAGEEEDEQSGEMHFGFIKLICGLNENDWLTNEI